MNWIYLSPHLDDAALSCGGLIWQQSRAGQRVEVWTICAGDPPEGDVSPFALSLQERWGTGPQAVEHRRAEDRASCEVLGAVSVHFAVPDCIYRRDGATGEALYATEESLNGELHPSEAHLVHLLADQMKLRLVALPGETELVCPLTLGGHVDHRLTRAAAELLGRPLWYYPDYPYAVRKPDTVAGVARQTLEAVTFEISPEAMRAWEDSVAAHVSQISTFWASEDSMRSDLRDFSALSGRGVRLWRPV